MLMYNCYFSHFKNIVELHSILLALTCSCTLILAPSNIELIADCQWDFTCWELIEDGFLQFAVFTYDVTVVRAKHVVDIKLESQAVLQKAFVYWHVGVEQRFVDEQVEEEENAQNIIDNLRMIKDNGYGLYMLDKELGARVYTQAAPLANKA